MVATSGLIPPLGGFLFFFMGLTSAVPTIPRETLAIRQATTFASVAARSPIPTASIIATETNLAGAINGCTSVSLLVYTDASSTVSTDTLCIGSRFPISTDSAMASSQAALASSLEPVSVPASGCAIGTKHDGSNQGYCTCAGSGTASASSVSTILGYSKGTLTTACDTGTGSLPTGYVEVPEISAANGAKWLWADPPSFDVAGNCTSGDTLDPRCWEALWMDDYVKWWWGAFNHTCSQNMTFAGCFYQSMTPYSTSDCSILPVQNPSPCTKPDWKDFRGKWNDVRNLYVAVSSFCPVSCLLY